MRIRRIWAVALLSAACHSSGSESGEAVAEAPVSSADQLPSDRTPNPLREGAGQSTTHPARGSAPDGPVTAAQDVQPPLTPQGWGALRIGMTRAQVVEAAGEDANPGAVGGPEPERCDQFRPAEAPEGILVMIEDGRLTRISISEGTHVVTEAGFGVGASADSIEAAYAGRAVVSPHKYLAAPGAYITVWETEPDEGAARGIVYEIGLDGRVLHIHAGSSSIQYVEGCL